jgi:hypothetical protein
MPKMDKNTLFKVMSTSACNSMVVSSSRVKCKTIIETYGQVDGSIITSLVKLEADQHVLVNVSAVDRKNGVFAIRPLIGKNNFMGFDNTIVFKHEKLNTVVSCKNSGVQMKIYRIQNVVSLSKVLTYQSFVLPKFSN